MTNKHPVESFALSTRMMVTVPRVPITESEFTDLRTALSSLDCIHLIEESWDALIANYRDLEAAVWHMAFSNILHGVNFDYTEADDARRNCTRLVDNFLTTTRAFLDKTPSRLKTILGPEAQKDFFEATNAAYDKYAGYKFMDNLRNYSQHHGSSIDGIVFGINRQENNDGSSILIHEAKIRVHRTVLDKKFKKHAREVLERVSDKRGQIDIIPLVREYIDGLNGIMQLARKMIAPHQDRWLTINETAIERITASGGTKFGLCAARYSAPNQAIEVIDLHGLARARLERLQRRNHSLSHITRATTRI